MHALKSRRRKVVVGAIVIVVLGGGASAYAMSQSGTTTSAALSLVAAMESSESESVVTTGTVEPAQDEDLSFSASGTVTAINATVGRKVSKGAVLATIDATMLESAVTTAAASVTSAESSVTSEESSTSVQLAAAEAALAEAEDQLTQAKTALSEAKIVAPFTGVVASVDMAVGDTVGGQSSTSDAITLFSDGSWIVNATVGSADLAELQKGQKATVVPSGARASVSGTVTSVGVVATTSTDDTSATFPVVIAIAGSPTGLYAGATDDVTVVTKTLANVLTVPTRALHTVNGRTVVYQESGGHQVSTPVAVGTSYGEVTQITSGLKAGDEILSTQATLGSGMPGGGTARERS